MELETGVERKEGRYSREVELEGMKMEWESGVGRKEGGVGEWSWNKGRKEGRWNRRVEYVGRWSRRVELEGRKVE